MLSRGKYSMNDNQMHDIEFWENEYLNQIYYLLNIDKEKMLSGFNTKEDIRNDWQQFLGNEISDFATGSERIFYWLFSQFGVPNSSPIGSDMFFETYNAYVHIDIKTVTLANIGDFKKNIFVGDNQNSYIGNINVRGKEPRPYKGNLPIYYTKRDGSKKICLTYFIVILYDESNLDIQTIAIICMPNGGLNLGNNVGYHNEEIIALMNKVKHIVDENERQQIFDRIQEIAVEEQPVVPLFNDVNIVAYNKRLKNYKPLIYGVDLSKVELVKEND